MGAWSTTPEKSLRAESCGCGLRKPARANRQSPWNGSQALPLTLTKPPCSCGSGSWWLCACSQCANPSQCIKLNTSVAPCRNLMSQNVLEQALLFQSTLLGGIFLHTSCVARWTPFPALVSLCLLFCVWFSVVSLGFYFVLPVMCSVSAPQYIFGNASGVGTLNAVMYLLLISILVSLYTEMESAPCLLPQSTTVICCMLKKTSTPRNNLSDNLDPSS